MSAYNVSRSSGLLKTVEREIKANELTAAATTQTIEAIQLPSKAVVTQVAFTLDEEFDGGATTELTIQVGDGTNPDGYIEAASVHADATSVAAGIVDGAYLNDSTTDNVVNGKLYSAADTIDVLFTATDANVSVLTAGKVRVIVSYLDLS
jgi:hypothetical protein